MIETALAFWLAWKFEIICTTLLVSFPFVRKHFRHNIIVAEFVRQATEQIATAMEANPDPTTGAPVDASRSQRKKRRRDVRARIAKEARKANRKSK
jgi:hypothetical protein